MNGLDQCDSVAGRDNSALAHWVPVPTTALRRALASSGGSSVPWTLSSELIIRLQGVLGTCEEWKVRSRREIRRAAGFGSGAVQQPNRQTAPSVLGISTQGVKTCWRSGRLLLSQETSQIASAGKDSYTVAIGRSEEHTSELQSLRQLV